MKLQTPGKALGAFPRVSGSCKRRAYVPDQRIVAVGLLTQNDLNALGQSFDRAWPITETPCFNALLHAIDVADRQFRSAQNQNLDMNLRPIEVRD
jgi:hypothetical protein